MGRKTRPQPSNLPAKRPDEQNRIGVFAAEINKRRRALAELLPEGFSPERMVALCLQSFRRNPQLANCTVDSVLCAMFECAKLGLEPDTPMGLCHLVPYKNECQFVLGYQGAKVLVARSGDVAKVWAEHRFANDEWNMRRGTDPHLHHVPADGERGEYLGTYAVCEYRDTRVKPSFEYVHRGSMDAIEAHAHGCDVTELEATRKRAESDWKKKNKPWIKWRDRMRMKTAIKRLAKQLIAYDQMGAEQRRAFLLDDLASSRQSQATITQPPPAPGERGRLEVVADQAIDEGAASLALEAEHEHDQADEVVETEAVETEQPEDDTPSPTDEEADAIAKLAHKISEEHPDMRQAVAAVVISDAPAAEKLAELEAIAEQCDGGMSPTEEEAFLASKGESGE